jgi:N-acetylmuramoyl-L-alanine amidase
MAVFALPRDAHARTLFAALLLRLLMLVRSCWQNVLLWCSMCSVLFMLGCAKPRAGQHHARQGDEIMIAGQMFHTGGARVKLWFDEGGYDGYRIERRFAKWPDAGWEVTHKAGKLNQPERFGLRFGKSMSDEDISRVRGGAWPLAMLQDRVDQFIIHYDAAGMSRSCFRTLHDERGLSIHFMIDLDGTIYQTLDVQERAWHATTSNDRSVGVEIANIGAYAFTRDEAGDIIMPATLARWYARDDKGWRVTLPGWVGDGGIATPNFVARPARDELVTGKVQGQELAQFDLTNEQYDALIKLTATLHAVLPRIALDVPRHEQGVVTSKLSDDALVKSTGLLGHFHMQDNKIDPGPAFDWERVIGGAKRQVRRYPLPP